MKGQTARRASRLWLFVAIVPLFASACRDRQLPAEPEHARWSTVPERARSIVAAIPEQPGALPVPTFAGNAATPDPVHTRAIPQNRFLAPNGTSNVHDDSYMSDTYEPAGPLGKSPRVSSAYLGTPEDSVALPISMSFDRYGRILMIPVGQKIARLLLLDPATLDTLATLPLPARAGTGVSNVVAGSYFYLDRLDRVVLPTINRQIWVVDVIGGWNRPRFSVNHVYDLTSAIGAADAIGSVLPDFAGTLWVVTVGGAVITVDPASGRTAIVRLAGERIENSLAADETGGVFIVSDHALYRFDAGRKGEPVLTWRESYDRGSRRKPGQLAQGSGTTPTLMGKDFVAIADNADPYMHVLVYRRGPMVTAPRLVTAVPVFGADQGATENSLIGTDRSLIVENNYGYVGPQATFAGRTTAPGITRIDLDADGHGTTIWSSMERVPSLITKLSLANGLIYSYTKDPGPGTTDAWYFTAIDFRTGRTVWKQLAGTGAYYNNHYSGLHLGPDGTMYVGVGGGVVALRDGR